MPSPTIHPSYYLWLAAIFLMLIVAQTADSGGDETPSTSDQPAAPSP